MVRFSEKETCKLVELYRDHECLWNNNSDHYRNKRMKQAACEAIAREMNLEDFTAADVKTKLKNLRGTYNQELIKIRRFVQAGDVNYKTNMKWFSIMESFIKKHTNQHQPGDNSSLENASEGIFPDDYQWERSRSNSELACVSVSSAPSLPSESEIEQSIRPITDLEPIAVTPEIQNSQSISKSEVYTVLPEIQSVQPVSHSQLMTVTPEILTVKAVSNPEPLPVTSEIKSVKSVSNSEVFTVTPDSRQRGKPASNPGVAAVPSGIETVKSASSPKLFALIPEVQTSKSGSNPNYITISPGSKQNVRYVGGSQMISLAPEIQQRGKQISADETRKRRHEEVSSTNSNNDFFQMSKTRAVVDDFSDRSDDEMGAFGHFVALNLRKMSMQSALSAQTEILSVLTRHRLNDSNLPQKQIVPYILTNGSSSHQNPVMLQKVFLKS